MKDNYDLIIDALLKCGYSFDDALFIVSGFLEEEALLYVECMMSIDDKDNHPVLH